MKVETQKSTKIWKRMRYRTLDSKATSGVDDEPEPATADPPISDPESPDGIELIF